MNVLVTGGAGFIGSALARKLIARGDSVVVLDNLFTGSKKNIPSEAIFIEADCSTEKGIELLVGYSFDVIFHFAGQSSGEVSFNLPAIDLHCNTVSTLLLLEYAVKSKCPRFIYASTMSVYGQKVSESNNKPKEQYAETDSTEPLSFYAVGKLASEKYLKIYKDNYNINTTSLRLFNTYGPGQNMENLKQGMVSIYLRQLVDEKFDRIVVKGNKNRFRDFIHVEDVVDITIRMINAQPSFGEIYNVGTGVKTTVAELLYILQSITGISKPIEYLGSTPGDQYGVYADNKKLVNLFPAIEYCPLEKGLLYASCFSPVISKKQ